MTRSAEPGVRHQTPTLKDRKADIGKGLSLSSSSDRLICGVLIILSGALRFPGLGASSYWYDDAWVAIASRADSVSDFIEVSVTTPLFNHAIGLVIRLFGLRVLYGQALPFVAGSLFAGVAYLAIRALAVNRYPALAASLVAVFAPAPLVYSVYIKHYTIEALFIGLLLFSAIQITRASAGWAAEPKFYVLVTCVGVLLSATVGVTAVSVLAVVFLIVSIDNRGIDRRLGFYLAGLAIISFAYWLLYLRPSVTDVLYNYWSPFFIETHSVSAFFSSLVTRTASVFKVFYHYGWVAWIVLPGSAVVLAARARQRELLIVSAPVLATILLASFGLTPFGTSDYGGRIDIHLLASMVGVVALILESAVRLAPRFGLFIAGLAVVCVICGGIINYDKPFYRQHDIRVLVEYIETQEAQLDDPSEAAIIVSPEARYAFALYTKAAIDIFDSDIYATGFRVATPDPDITFLTAPSRLTPIPRDIDIARYIPEVASAVQNRSEVWFIHHLWGRNRATVDEQINPVVTLIEREGFTETERREVPGAILVRLSSLALD